VAQSPGRLGRQHDRHAPPVTAPPAHVERNGYVSVQVNVDEFGNNIVGDAATQPSIAVAPDNPHYVVVIWRHFYVPAYSPVRGAYAYSLNGGRTWTFPGASGWLWLRGDNPVAAPDARGRFYYASTDDPVANLAVTEDLGVTWNYLPAEQIVIVDRLWMAIDRTDSPGRGNIYVVSDPFGYLMRSTNAGLTFEYAMSMVYHEFGTVAVGPDGEVYWAGFWGLPYVGRSLSARDPDQLPVIESESQVPLGIIAVGEPNGEGPLGRMWVAVDCSDLPTRGNVYALASVRNYDLADVMFSRSEDGGQTWSAPIRVDDPSGAPNGPQWFGAISVAPNGRIDAVWFHTGAGLTELRYAFSTDAGNTWSAPVAVSPLFDHTIRDPTNKLGDHLQIVSDEAGANVVYPATFNGEPDIWFVRVGMRDCNGNGVDDDQDIASGTSQDDLPPGGDGVPDECQSDCNGNSVPDVFDTVFGGSADCNLNRRPDTCDILTGDCNGDGILDGCQVRGPQNGYALDFNGIRWAWWSHVAVPHSSALFFPAGQPITIEAWIRPREAGGRRTILTKGSGGIGDVNYWLILLNGRIVFRYDSGDATTRFRYETMDPVAPADMWTHVAVTHTFGTDSITVYINGAPVAGTWTAGPPDSVARPPDAPLLIGASDSAYVFDGLIDEVRIWRTIRTQQQIHAARFRDVSGEPGLIGYWRFDEGMGDVAIDSAGGNDGQVSGADWIGTSVVPGDIDGDGAVGITDLLRLLLSFDACDTNARFDPQADLDDSGCVDLDDLAVLIRWFGRSCP